MHLVSNFAVVIADKVKSLELRSGDTVGLLLEGANSESKEPQTHGVGL